jgi:hypothetical protein
MYCCSCRWGETVSLNCGHQRPIVHTPGNINYEYEQPRWNDIDRGKQKNSKKTCPTATLSNTNLTWTDQVANPGLRAERPMTFLRTNAELCGNTTRFNLCSRKRQVFGFTLRSLDPLVRKLCG